MTGWNGEAIEQHIQMAMTRPQSSFRTYQSTNSDFEAFLIATLGPAAVAACGFDTIEQCLRRTWPSRDGIGIHRS